MCIQGCLEILRRKALKYITSVQKTICNKFSFNELAWPTLTSNVKRYSFINPYIKLMERYNSANKITEKSLHDTHDVIHLKAGCKQSRDLTYIALNPTLKRPDISDSIVPTFKLHHTTRIRMISQSLQR